MVIDADTLCTIVADIAKVDKEEITSKSRVWPLTVCRDILYDYYNKKGFSTTRTGRMLNRDHATVYSGLKRLEGWIEAHDQFVMTLYENFWNEVQHHE